MVGESLAGLFVVETFVLEPELFDTYFAFDPSLWWNDGKLIAEAERRLRGRRGKPTTLYMASSDEKEIADDAARLAAMLQRANASGLSWHYEPMPEESHGTIYHPRRSARSGAF